MSDTSSKNRLNSAFVRYSIAAIAVVFAFLFRQALTQYVGMELPPFITFYPAIMVAAVLGGLWPGLGASALASLLADYWILKPVRHFAVANDSETVALAFFFATGVFMSVVAERYRRNQLRIAVLEKEQIARENEEKLRQSNEQFLTLANAIPQLCWMANPDGWTFWYNQRWYSYTGTTPKDMEGWGWQSVHDPETLPRVLEQWNNSILTGRPFDMVFPLRGADGVFRPFLTRVMPVVDAEGKVVRWFGTNTDIHEQKEIETQLRNSKARLDLAVEVASLGEWDLDLINKTGFHSKRHAEIFGYDSPLPDWSYPRFMEHVLPHCRPDVEAKIRLLEAGGIRDFETQIRRVDGEVRWIWVRGRSLLNESGQLIRVFGTVMDITERKEAEEQFYQVSRTLTALSSITHALLHAVDEKTLLQQACRILYEDCGYAMIWIGIAEHDEYKSVRPIASCGFDDGYLETLRITWADSERGRGPTGTAIRTGQRAMCRNMLSDPAFLPWREEAGKRGYSASLVIPLIEGDTAFGAITIYSGELNAFSDDEITLLTELAGDLAYGIHALRLRSANALAEQALRDSEQRWATTLKSIGDAVISTDATGKIEFMNEVAQKLTGWSLPEVKGRDLGQVFNIVQEGSRIIPESPVAKVIRLGKIVGLANHTLLIRRDGAEIPIDDSAAPIRDSEDHMQGVVLVFHDVSEQRSAEKALRNSDRLATTGRLAATIAHEIHNPLDAIGGLLHLIKQDTQEDSTREFAAMAGQELVRITQMTQQMLAFQREAAKPVPVKLGEVLGNVIGLYERKVKSSGIQLGYKIDSDIELIALPGELRQMVANLVGNAIEAVAPHVGRIHLRAHASRDWRSDRLGVRVVVADNGPGIPTDVRTRIFEPFFTTKGESGTGLGLWITADILRKYEGVMQLRSRTEFPFRGTCFSVFLPFQVSSDMRVRSSGASM